MDYKNVVVTKPWGYEYLVYENKDVALWHLHINAGQSTSMHCHPKKTTGLILLNGVAEVSFLADKRIIKGLDKIMIRRGLFHKTTALSENGIDVLEIETPNDKEDLVRLSDEYGRENKPYETIYQDKNEDCLEIDDTYDVIPDFKGCNIYVNTVRNDIKHIFDYKDDDILTFLKGGMMRTINGVSHLVTVPGDVGLGKIIKGVARQLDSLHPDTVIMNIRK